MVNNDDDTVIASHVDLKMFSVKQLHANWVINTHNLIPSLPELIRSCFRKVGLLSDYWHYTWLFMILHVYGLLHTIHFFISV